MKKTKNMNVIRTVALVTALSLLGDSMLYIALPIYYDQAGLDSLWQVGVLLSINRFVRLPTAPFIGWLYKKISLKTGLYIATALGAITTLGYGFFNGFIAWIVLRSLWGIAWSFFRIGGLTSVSYYAEEKELGKAMGTYNGLHRLGSLFGMLLGGILVPMIGLKLVALIFGFLSLAGLPFILYFLRADDREATAQQSPIKVQISSQFGFQLKYNVILILVTAFFITMFIQGVLASTLSSIIDYNYGEFVSIYHFVLSAALLSGLIQSCRWVWEPFLASKIGMWSDGKFGRIPLFIIFLVMTGILFGMISFELSLIAWIGVTLLVMIGATAITTIMDSIAIDRSRSSTVTFLTIYTIIQDIGASLGPFLSYMVIALDGGFYFLYLSGTGTILLLSVCWLFYLKMENAKKHTQLNLQ